VRDEIEHYRQAIAEARPINIDQLRAGFRGRTYAELVSHHLRKQSPSERRLGITGTVLLIPDEMKVATEAFIDRWNERSRDRAFWQPDCADVFDEIVADARTTAQTAGVTADDELAFNLFNLVTLNFADCASDQPALREFAEIRAPGCLVTGSLALITALAALVAYISNGI